MVEDSWVVVTGEYDGGGFVGEGGSPDAPGEGPSRFSNGFDDFSAMVSSA